MHGREPTTIPFSTEAVRANLLRLETEWEMVQESHDRDAIYGYLTAVFELVVCWQKEGKAVRRAFERYTCEGTIRNESQNRLPL